MVRKILFVDNDQDTSREFKNTLRTKCGEWEVENAVNGNDALAFMSKFSFDAVVSDLEIQDMGGVELLNIVNERYPETVRIIHSRLTDPELILDEKNAVHQFLMKPCSAETMKNTIERTCILRDLLKDEALKKIIAGIRTLPSLPALYNLIVAEMQSPDPSLRKVGDLISQDVSMSAKILQLINSALFALPQKIADPQQAVVYVGIETLKSLVLSYHVFSSLAEDAESCGFSLLKMWRHSLRTGRLARDIARAEKAGGRVAEEAMISGMLHDVGKLIVLKVPGKYHEIMNLVEAAGCGYSEAEYTVMATSHSELGAYLLGLWGLPGNVVETVAFHHKPSRLIDGVFVTQDEPSEELYTSESEEGKSILSVESHSSGFSTLTAVHVANALAMQGNCSSETSSFPYVDMAYLERLGLADKLPEWAELYQNTMQLSQIKFR